MMDAAVDILLRRFVLVVAILATVSYVAIYTRPNAPLPIRSDGYNYYIYLPSWILYRDLTLESPARDCCGGAYPEFTGIRRWPGTGRLVNRLPIGEAILTLPFFLAAHLLTRWSNLPPDGFSLYYQHAAGLAGIAYLLAGLAIVRRILIPHVSTGITLATLVAITWGTNLFHYGVYDGTFSHVFSFFLIGSLLMLTRSWWTTPTVALDLAMGVIAALVVLTRHTNAIFLALVPLYGVASWRDLAERGAELWRRRGAVALMTIVAVVCVLPQLAIYRASTGSWLVNAYAPIGVGFNFQSPHLWGVLFSTEKGLFFWSPVLLLAIWGVVAARSRIRPRELVIPAVFVLTVNTYLIASWSDWQFGGSYGHRAFTDGFAIVAPLMAASFAWFAERPRLCVGVTVAASAAVMLSVFQMIQYWGGLVPFSGTTWAQYRSIFLKLP